MTIESAIDEIHEAGLHVNNLFELEPDHWRANLTDGESYFSFANSPTPELALSSALAERGLGEPLYHATLTAEEVGAAKSIADLLG